MSKPVDDFQNFQTINKFPQGDITKPEKNKIIQSTSIFEKVRDFFKLKFELDSSYDVKKMKKKATNIQAEFKKLKQTLMQLDADLSPGVTDTAKIKEQIYKIRMLRENIRRTIGDSSHANSGTEKVIKQLDTNTLTKLSKLLKGTKLMMFLRSEAREKKDREAARHSKDFANLDVIVKETLDSLKFLDRLTGAHKYIDAIENKYRCLWLDFGLGNFDEQELRDKAQDIVNRLELVKQFLITKKDDLVYRNNLSISHLEHELQYIDALDNNIRKQTKLPGTQQELPELKDVTDKDVEKAQKMETSMNELWNFFQKNIDNPLLMEVFMKHIHDYSTEELHEIYRSADSELNNLKFSTRLKDNCISFLLSHNLPLSPEMLVKMDIQHFKAMNKEQIDKFVDVYKNQKSQVEYKIKAGITFEINDAYMKVNLINRAKHLVDADIKAGRLKVENLPSLAPPKVTSIPKKTTTSQKPFVRDPYDRSPQVRVPNKPVLIRAPDNRANMSSVVVPTSMTNLESMSLSQEFNTTESNFSRDMKILGEFYQQKLPENMKLLSDFFLILHKESGKISKEIQKICKDKQKDEEAQLEAIGKLYFKYFKIDSDYVNAMIDVATNWKTINEKLPHHKNFKETINEFNRTSGQDYASLCIKTIQRLPQILLAFENAGKKYPKNQNIQKVLPVIKDVADKINKSAPE